MKFESIVRKISSWAAAIIVYLVALSFYLNAKGFIMGPNNYPVLVQTAQAAEQTTPNTVPTNLSLPEGPSLGAKNAPITLYEFSSLGCFHCADFHLKTLPALEKDYIKTGKLRVVYIDLPLEAKSMQAALTARCMPASKYFDFVSLLYKKQRDWSMAGNSKEVLQKLAALNGLSEKSFNACIDNKQAAQEILDTRQNAITRLGLKGTPTLIIATAKERQIFNGAPSLKELKDILNKKLSQK